MGLSPSAFIDQLDDRKQPTIDLHIDRLSDRVRLRHRRPSRIQARYAANSVSCGATMGRSSTASSTGVRAPS